MVRPHRDDNLRNVGYRRCVRVVLNSSAIIVPARIHIFITAASHIQSPIRWSTTHGESKLFGGPPCSEYRMAMVPKLRTSFPVRFPAVQQRHPVLTLILSHDHHQFDLSVVVHTDVRAIQMLTPL